MDSLEEKGVKGRGSFGSLRVLGIGSCANLYLANRFRKSSEPFLSFKFCFFLFLSTQTLLLSQYSASLSLPFLLLNLPYISDWTYSNPPSFLILSSASFVFFANLSKPASPSTCFYSKSVSFFWEPKLSSLDHSLPSSSISRVQSFLPPLCLLPYPVLCLLERTTLCQIW